MKCTRRSLILCLSALLHRQVASFSSVVPSAVSLEASIHPLLPLVSASRNISPSLVHHTYHNHPATPWHNISSYLISIALPLLCPFPSCRNRSTDATTHNTPNSNQRRHGFHHHEEAPARHPLHRPSFAGSPRHHCWPSIACRPYDLGSCCPSQHPSRLHQRRFSPKRPFGRQDESCKR